MAVPAAQTVSPLQEETKALSLCRVPAPVSAPELASDPVSEQVPLLVSARASLREKATARFPERVRASPLARVLALVRELVLVRVPRRQDRWGNFIAKWFKLPDDKKIELDQIGSDVWELCDGTHSVESIASRISKSYQLNKRQAEASVTAYLKMLADRRLIGLQTGTTKKK